MASPRHEDAPHARSGARAAIGTGSGTEPAERQPENEMSGSRLERFTGLTSSRLRLRAMPASTIHPLQIFLLERGVSLVDGARLLGVSVRTLHRWFTGAAAPTYYVAQHIAVDLGVDVDALFPITR